MEANTKVRYLEYCKMSFDEVKSLESSFDYQDLIDFCGVLLEENEFLELDGSKVLLDSAVKQIWNKYYDDKVISEEELNVFLGVLDLDNKEFLGIKDINIIKRYIPSNSKELGGKVGKCIHNLLREKYLLLFSDSLITDVLGNTEFNNLYSVMISLCHEDVHVAQDQEIINCIDLRTFILSLESLVRFEEYDYYEKNYDYLLVEMDANNRGGILIHNFFKKHGLLTKEKLDGIEQIYKDEKKASDEKFNRHKVLYNDKMDYACKQLFYICEHRLKLLHFFLDDFPLLKISYDEDGNMKSIIELVRDKKKLEENNDTNINQYNDIYIIIYLINFII